MMEVFRLLCFAVFLHTAVVFGEPCFDSTTVHYEGETWIYRENLKVICQKGEIVPLNCVTSLGTIIPLGTKDFMENDIIYSCLLDEGAKDAVADTEGSGSGEEELLAVGQPQCSAKTVGLEWSDDNAFAYKCADGGVIKIVGCVAAKGRIVGNGEAFVTDNGALKLCRIAKKGEEARVENKGCYMNPENSENTDLIKINSTDHKAKYSTWKIGDIEYRCGDQGIYTYKCFVEIKGKRREVYSNFAWLDSAGVLQFCG